MNPECYVQILNTGAIFPTKAHDDDAGWDLSSNIGDHTTMIMPHRTLVVPTGIALELTEGYYGLVLSRSGLAASGLIVANAPGLIDNGYRGEIKVILHNLNDEKVFILAHQRIAQLVIMKTIDVAMFRIATLNSSERGTDGLGSTGLL